VTDSHAPPSASPPSDLARPGLIDREHLLATLDRAAERRVTVISAPAGSGKSTLLRTWAERARHDRRIAFVSVRPDQQDAQMFWLTLLAAIRASSGADQGAEPPQATPGSDASAVLDKVLSEIGAQLESVVLIVDDLHELAFPEATEQLTELLNGLPRHAHAIVGTRRDLPLRLHQMRLAGELSEIRAGQLSFTQDETRELLAAAGIALPAPVVEQLHQRTEGWAAGLRLAALSLARHPEPERFIAEFSGSDRTVAEYLVAEMLERQPPEVQRLLLRTSPLDRVNGELADLLAGGTGSERILLDLEDANAFVVSLDPGRTWFRYHRMFSDLLRLELRRTTPGDIPELHRLAAQWLAENGQAAEAIGHLQAAGEWAEAARLLTDRALSLTLDGQAGTAAALLRSFPAAAGNDSPGLALVYAIADLEQVRLDQAEAHLQVATSYAAVAPLASRHRLRMSIASLHLLLARLRGNFDGVVEQASAILAAAVGESSADVSLGNDLRAVALLNLGVTEAWSLRLADSERHLLDGAGLARRIGRPYLEVSCLAYLGFASTIHTFALAQQRCKEAIARAAKYGWVSDPVIAPALAALANALIWTGQFAEGQRWLERARRATQDDGEPGVRLLVCLTSAIFQAACGNSEEAMEQFDAARQMQALMVREHALTSRVTAWSIATQARRGMVDDARAALAALDAPHAARGEIRNAAAALRLAEQDPQAARRELQPVLDGTAPVHSYLTRVEAYLLAALADRDLGDARASRAALEQALGLADADRLVLPFAMTGAWKLLEALPPQGARRAALVADILDALRGDVAAPPARLPADELSASELRVLRYLPTNLTRPEIAAELSVSLNTVSTHIRRIYAKLGAADRSSAVRRGRELRLLSSGAPERRTIIKSR